MNHAAILAVLATLFAVALPVLAQPGDGRVMEREAGQRQQWRERMREERGELRRDLRGESWRQDAPRDRCDPPCRCDGSCRMTTEERRQLRRDIDDAGRMLYGRGHRRGQD